VNTASETAIATTPMSWRKRLLRAGSVVVVVTLGARPSHPGNVGSTARSFCVARTPDGIASNGFSRLPAISADGSFLAFESAATNLAPDDDFGALDVFLGVREDTCPSDPAKLFPGVCGCGTADVDADHDGAFGCTDACPDDPQKTAAGICGCGTSDADSDADGTADCHDPNTVAGLAVLDET
jgi:hypothetical protein